MRVVLLLNMLTGASCAGVELVMYLFSSFLLDIIQTNLDLRFSLNHFQKTVSSLSIQEHFFEDDCVFCVIKLNKLGSDLCIFY